MKSSTDGFRNASSSAIRSLTFSKKITNGKISNSHRTNWRSSGARDSALLLTAKPPFRITIMDIAEKIPRILKGMQRKNSL